MQIRLGAPIILLSMSILAGCGGGGGGGNTFTPPVASDPVWLVFSADKSVDERSELFASLSDNSIGPINLSDDIEPMQVEQFAVSSDGRWVAFTARGDEDASGTIDTGDGPFDLYWTRVDGATAPVRISGELPAHARISYFEWSPVTSSLVFNADIDTDDVGEIYIVTQTTPMAVKINGNVGSTVEMGEVRWSPDGRYVAQLVHNRNSTSSSTTDRIAINVYDTTASGPNSTRISGPNLPGGTLGTPITGRHIDSTVIWAPDSSRLAYLIRDWDAGSSIHYQAFPNGSFERITAPLDPSESGSLQMAWSSDSRYLAHAIFTDPIGINKLDVFDTATNLTHRAVTAPNGGNFSNAGSNIHWRPGSHEIAVFSSTAPAGAAELYIVPGNVVNTVLPSPASTPGPGEFFVNSAWSADGRYLGSIERDTGDSTLELVTFEPDAGNLRVVVSHANSSARQYPTFDWITGHRLLYSFADGIHVADAGQTRSGSAIEGGLDFDLGMLGVEIVIARANGLVSDPDDQTIGFIAYRPGTDVRALYHVRPNGAGRIDLTGTVIADGDVVDFAFGAEASP